MRTCKRCLYSSAHPLYITFDKDGLCSGCSVHEEKDELNWAERGSKLASIFDSYKNISGNNYDCIIPVSGARDSYFIVHIVKNIYKMNPLLVTYNKQYNTDLGIHNLANLRMKFNCDIMTLTVDPETVKKITRASLRKAGSIYWHCIAGQTVFPVQTAVKLKIPLIVWGAHQGTDQVGMFSHLDEVEMTRKYRKEHDLMGFEAEDLVSELDAINEKDITPYKYPDDEEIERIGVRGIYLNNYIRWDSRMQHEEMIKLYDYQTSPQTRTFDTYNDVDCFNYSDVHDHIKYLKHGYGKVTDHVCREIRLKRMTREEGIKLARQFKNEKPKYLEQFLDWIGMTESGFNFIIDQHRNQELWQRDEDWNWKEMTDLLSLAEKESNVEQARLKPNAAFEKFIVTPDHRPDYIDNKYILIGKGYHL